jgi:hypothetical protein
MKEKQVRHCGARRGVWIPEIQHEGTIQMCYHIGLDNRHASRRTMDRVHKVLLEAGLRHSMHDPYRMMRRLLATREES